jgi:protein SCO1/2
MLLYSCKEVPTKLPILGNADIVYLQKNGATIADTVYPKIPAFSFLNEDSILVSNENFKNKIWIVEFFFATCPTICPIMQKQLKNVVKATKGFENNIEFISFTIDPTNDSPSKLKAYKKQNKILNKNWSFLTGDEATTHRLGIENFLTFAGRNEEALGGYAHSGSFTLVDKAGYVRGVYNVTNFDLSVNKSEYNRLINDVESLLINEYGISKSK